MSDLQKSKLQQIIKFFQQTDENINYLDLRTEQYFNFLNQNIEILINTKDFFEIPLENILLIASKIEFLTVNDAPKTISAFIINTINSHPDEKETLMLLNAIKLKNWRFSFDDLIETLTSFTNSDLLSLLGQNYMYEKMVLKLMLITSFMKEKKKSKNLKLRLKNFQQRKKKKIRIVPLLMKRKYY